MYHTMFECIFIINITSYISLFRNKDFISHMSALNNILFFIDLIIFVFIDKVVFFEVFFKNIALYKNVQKVAPHPGLEPGPSG